MDTSHCPKNRRRELGLLALLLLSYCIFIFLLQCGILEIPIDQEFEALNHNIRRRNKEVLGKLLGDSPLPWVPRVPRVDRAAVVVGPNGSVKAPFSRLTEHLLKIATRRTWLNRDSPVLDDDFSIIISARNEEKYIIKTLLYLFENTPHERIRDVIVVDDYSVIPIADQIRRELPGHLQKYIRTIRFDSPQGLIRGRVVGADAAQSSNLFFLDAHCKPVKGWERFLLHHLKTNYRRVVCPMLNDIREDTWEDIGTHGYKMMFEWTFEFGWYEDLEMEIPVMSGGILAITKQWWTESGKYDMQMLEWGGENLEQSIRLWLCGGEIVLERRSQIGHIFSRPPKPNPQNKLVVQVQKNQKRGAKVWLDEYYVLFYKYHAEVRRHAEGDTTDRMELRYNKLSCMPFQWYVDKFKTAFERGGMLDSDFLHVYHPNTGMCLSAVDSKGTHRITVEDCNIRKREQQWLVVAGNRMIYNRGGRKCLDAATHGGEDPAVILYECDWNSVIRQRNANQFWQWDVGAIRENTGRIFVASTEDVVSLTGNDYIPINTTAVTIKTSRCLSVDVEYAGVQANTKHSTLQLRPCNQIVVASNDAMRFEPKWRREPLSTRFGTRTMTDARKITDAFAHDYITRAK